VYQIAETGITIDPPPSWQVRFEGPQNSTRVAGKRKVTGHPAFCQWHSAVVHPHSVRPIYQAQLGHVSRPTAVPRCIHNALGWCLPAVTRKGASMVAGHRGNGSEDSWPYNSPAFVLRPDPDACSTSPAYGTAREPLTTSITCAVLRYVRSTKRGPESTGFVIPLNKIEAGNWNLEYHTALGIHRRVSRRSTVSHLSHIAVYDMSGRETPFPSMSCYSGLLVPIPSPPLQERFGRAGQSR